MKSREREQDEGQAPTLGANVICQVLSQIGVLHCKYRQGDSQRHTGKQEVGPVKLLAQGNGQMTEHRVEADAG